MGIHLFKMKLFRKYIYLILIFSPIATDSFGQSRCGKVLDAATHRSIPYASLHIPGKGIGMYASDNGDFCFTMPVENSSNVGLDSLVVSALGYKALRIDLKSFLLNDTLRLLPEPIVLQEVVVRSKKRGKHSKTIGYFKKPMFELRSFGFSHNSNALLATYIPSRGDSAAVITKVFCRTTPRKNGSVQSFRVALRLYDHDTFTQLPGKDLLDELLVSEVEPDQSAIFFDLGTHSIRLPQPGFWIGVTCVGYTDALGNYIPNRDRKFGKVTFRNTKKLKVATIEHIAPMYNYTTDQGGLPRKSVTAGWNGIWYPRTEKENMVFSFGAEIVW